MKVVIAEKPSVGEELAKFLKATSRKDGYSEGNGYQVTWAMGHLIELAPPEAYGFEKWNMDELPIIPSNFKLQIKEESGRKKQFKIIKQLFEGCDEIIVATDAGREGELIFRYIYEFCGSKKPFKRLWLKSPTEKAISEAFNNLKPGSSYDSMYHSARCRSEADWLVGMNATRALTLTGKTNGVLSIGRVQTPVLVIICERYLENKAFVKEKYFQIRLTLEYGTFKFWSLCTNNFKTNPEAQSILTAIKGNAKLIKKEVKLVNDSPPALFDLSSLQQECNKRFGFTAQKTLDYIQELYEKYKLLTYPRTDSRYLTEDLKLEVPGLIKLLEGHPNIGNYAQKLSSMELSVRPFNDAKVKDHHAIIITEIEAPKDLPEKLRQVYDLVATRFLSAFGQTSKRESIKYVFENGNYTFESNGTNILFTGWKEVETPIQEDQEEKEENQKLPPQLEEGDLLKIFHKEVLEKTTQPKKIHTEASLLHVMETAGKEIEDPELREAMKEADAGLGTAATRAATIETLFEREYIQRDKSKILPTAKGLSVYEVIKDQPIGNVELTGKWEKALGAIYKGKLDPERFLSEIKKFTGHIVNEFKQNVSESHFQNHYEDCPKCKKGKLIPYPKTLTCNNEQCKWVLWKNVCGKDLTETNIKALLSGKQTSVIKGFKGTKSSFDAKLKLDADLTIKFVFDKK